MYIKGSFSVYKKYSTIFLFAFIILVLQLFLLCFLFITHKNNGDGPHYIFHILDTHVKQLFFYIRVNYCYIYCVIFNNCVLFVKKYLGPSLLFLILQQYFILGMFHHKKTNLLLNLILPDHLHYGRSQLYHYYSYS